MKTRIEIEKLTDQEVAIAAINRDLTQELFLIEEYIQRYQKRKDAVLFQLRAMGGIEEVE